MMMENAEAMPIVVMMKDRKHEDDDGHERLGHGGVQPIHGGVQNCHDELPRVLNNWKLKSCNEKL
jgi:hypothetical protein